MMAFSFVRVVRGDGTVENDWQEFDRSDNRVHIAKVHTPMTKSPSVELFDCWQNGGMCRSTREHRSEHGEEAES